MKVEATVDVGQNLASLVERLAQQIGTTADKIFPWYVEQAYLQGMTHLAATVVALVVALAVLVPAYRRSDFNNGNGAAVLTVAASVVLGLATVATLVFGPMNIRKMINPQFYAVTMLAEDIGKMRGR